MAAGLNTYAYVENYPINSVDEIGLNCRVMNPSNGSSTINFQATSLINQIRRYDPTFTYSMVSPNYSLSKYNRTDINPLNTRLNEVQSRKTCLPASYWINDYGRSNNQRDLYAKPGV